jgi:hypothetical protein
MIKQKTGVLRKLRKKLIKFSSTHEYSVDFDISPIYEICLWVILYFQ